MDPESGAPTDVLAKESLHTASLIGSAATTMSAAKEDSLWTAYIEKSIRTANGKAASQAQKVNKWVMLPRDFSEKTGELTPTLKLKRKVAAEHFADVIEQMYEGTQEA